jgi:hypothetical protein
VTSKITESADSPKSQSSGLNSSKTRTFEIYATSDTAAYNLMRLKAPSFDVVDGITLAATPVYKLDTIRAIDGGVNSYKGTVEYRHAGRDEQASPDNELIDIGREKVTCSFSGTTANVTTALNQNRYGTNARDVGLALNVQYDGTVDGLEVNVPTGSFTVSTVISKDVVTNEWLKARFEQIWTTNNATFRSWPRGCVALAGMDTRQRADGNWEIDYSFQIQPPETFTDIGGVSLGGSITKEGFAYTWVMFRPKEDAGKITPEPVGAYLAVVYKKSDFGQLGIQE